uniref:Uncharacterized protein n=1 Tax=viral metagenome TaxID=1070528 RepID=A0A6M3LFK6_9ZZZZ
MNKKELVALLADVKSGKVKLETVQAQLSATRGMAFNPEANITKISELKADKAYFIQNGALVSLPLNKIRNDGRTAEFVPYYRTLTGKN